MALKCIAADRDSRTLASHRKGGLSIVGWKIAVSGSGVGDVHVSSLKCQRV